MNDLSPRPTDGASRAGAYVVVRLLASLALMTVGTVGMYVGIVGLKPIAAEFGISRGVGSLPYALFMIGYAFGNVIHGRLADRYGILLPILVGSVALPAGLILSAQADSLWQFLATIAILGGTLGSSAVFAPIIADVSLWFGNIRLDYFERGNYLDDGLIKSRDFPQPLGFTALADDQKAAPKNVESGQEVIQARLPDRVVIGIEAADKPEMLEFHLRNQPHFDPRIGLKRFSFLDHLI